MSQGLEVLVEQLRSAGISRVAFCPGARALPLLEAFDQAGFEILPFFDERSAGFYASAQHATTVVVTTSGTAVGELMPAVMEAYHRRLSLIVVTADRPERARGRGTPQATDQRRVYGVFANYLEWPGEFSRVGQPLQINVCLEDPLRTGVKAPQVSKGEDFWRAEMRPLVMVGELAPPERPRVRDWLLKLQAPCYLEPLSGLREDEALRELALPVLGSLLSTLTMDRVIRIGGAPVHKFYRDLDVQYSHLPVAVLGREEWPGLLREVASGDLPEKIPSVAKEHLRAWMTLAREQSKKLKTLLDEFPRSEPSLLRGVSEALRPGTAIYLGNSMPIREWDLAATRESRDFVYAANRGLNGIDGQVSSFFGWDVSRPKVAILGDLTTLHDLNGFWAARWSKDSTVVVMQNGGGRIFDFGDAKRDQDGGQVARVMVNGHDLTFESVAALYRLEYSRNSKLRPADFESSGQCKLIELECDVEATRAFWKAFRET